MHRDSFNGEPRIIIDGLAELSAVRTLIDGFARFTKKELELPQEFHTGVAATVQAMGAAATVMFRLADAAGGRPESRNSFGQPYLDVIDMAVRTFEQHPEYLSPYIATDELIGAQIFFPITAESA